MEEEIKEILEDYSCIPRIKKLGDYITNLQEENERLNENNQAMQEEMVRTWKIADNYKNNLQEEIERLNNLINKTTSYYYKTLSEYNNQNKKMPDEAVMMYNLLENNK